MVATSGPGWLLAPCLKLMFDEADKRDPNRDRTSDGSIGDAAHAVRESDHNPADGWVCGADIDDDNDQANPGVDLLRAHLVATKDPRVKYLIRNGTIWKAYENRGLPPWTPQVYTGLNDHSHHLHISVWNTTEARNDLSPWWPKPTPPALPIAATEDEPMYFLKETGDPAVWFFEPGRYTHVPSGADGKALAKAARIPYTVVEVSPTFFGRLAHGRERSL